MVQKYVPHQNGLYHPISTNILYVIIYITYSLGRWKVFLKISSLFFLSPYQKSLLSSLYSKVSHVYHALQNSNKLLPISQFQSCFHADGCLL